MLSEATAGAFWSWVKNARRGERYVYHQGFLAPDRERLIPGPGGVLRRIYYEPANSMGKAALMAFQERKVMLVQQRNGPGSWLYIAVRL